MAQRITVLLDDDLDGSKADETVSFAIDGVEYEIDLSKKNAKALRDAFAEYITAGRKVARARRGARKPQTRRSDTTPIRQWAAANGYDISDRGRIPTHITEAYDAAT